MSMLQVKTGLDDSFSSILDDEESDGLQEGGTIKTEFRASFMEIFNDRVYDLLTSQDLLEAALPVREDVHGVYVEGLKEVTVKNTDEAEQLLFKGMSNRHVAATNMNRTSSRSHAVFVLNVRTEHTSFDGLQKVRNSKFTLVDLAGSERQKRTGELLFNYNWLSIPTVNHISLMHTLMLTIHVCDKRRLWREAEGSFNDQ